MCGVWLDLEKGFVSVQKRINTAGLSSLSFWRPACLWGPGFGVEPTLPHPISAVWCASLVCVNSVVYAGHLLSTLESETFSHHAVRFFSHHTVRGYMITIPLIPSSKTLDAGFPVGSLEQEHCTHVTPFSIIEGKRIQLCNLRMSL